MLAYRIELTPDDNGTFLLTCAALPEVTTFAEDADEAQSIACDAIEEALAARIARGEEVPASDPDGSSLPLLTELKVELYRACRAQGVIRAELARRLEWNRESVDRLFRLDHGSRLEQLEAAFSAIGLTVKLSVVGAGEERRPHA